MKKTILYIAAASVLALASCSKIAENIVPGEEISGEENLTTGKVKVVLKASMEIPVDSSTKAEVDPLTGSCTWNGGDEIAVFTKKGGLMTLKTTDADGTASASFEGEIDADDAIEEGVIAYYPASIAVKGNSAVVNLPDSYASAQEAARSFPLRGTVSGGSIVFSHLGGMMKITAEYLRDEIDQVVITLPNKVTGTLAVSAKGSDHEVVAGEESSTVTINISALKHDENLSTTTGLGIFSFPLPVGNYSGLTLAFKNSALGTFGEKATTKTIGKHPMKYVPNN